MKSFRYFLPTTDIIFGKGALEKLGTEAKKLGSKALVVTGKKSMQKLGILQKTVEILEKEGVKTVVFSGVEPNPTVETVNRGAQKAIEEKCDLIIGLGGGSSIDTAKNIAVVAGHFEGKEISIWEFAGINPDARSITSKTLPIVAITSTSGTGSHVSRFAVATNTQTKQKVGIMSPFVCPKLSIVDTEILRYLPPSITAQTGFDVMAHVTECFVSKLSNPITDLYCLKAIEFVFTYLPRAFKDGEDMEARYNMALADTYAGWALNTSRAVLPHAMSHPVSAFYPEIAHGTALAALTPKIMRFNIENADEETLKKYCQIAQAAGEKITSFTKEEALKS
ncbi:iron-containing alcohol dehydrogenase, partial [Candidatus Aerophobetes bacterium]|nr:iron-containing alcohol dehydrogenase [Candidatus Aerophobetes bacterium]